MLLLLSLACAPAEDSVEETYVPVDTNSKLECATMDIQPDLNDPDPPHVGDSWTIFLWCDDTLLTGASRVILTPPEAGTIAENVITWAEAGDVDVFMQTGVYKTTETISILE